MTQAQNIFVGVYAFNDTEDMTSFTYHIVEFKHPTWESALRAAVHAFVYHHGYDEWDDKELKELQDNIVQRAQNTQEAPDPYCCMCAVHRVTMHGRTYYLNFRAQELVELPR